MRSPKVYVGGALLLLLAVLVVRQGLCGRLKTGDVAIPPVTAGPVEVVRAYVAALDKHDLTTVKALATPEYAAEVERYADSWYRNTQSITDLRVEEPSPQSPGTAAPASEEAVWVGVTFDLDQCNPESMPDGETGWGYVLSRPSPRDRWLVTSEGKA